MNPSENEKKLSFNEKDEGFVHAMLYSTTCMVPMAINTANELDIFGIIDRAGAPISPSQIASHLPTKNPDLPYKLDRLLRLLACHSFLTCSLRTLENGKVERLYGLAPPSKFYLRDENEGSLASLMALNTHRATVEIFLQMKDAILNGGNQFSKVHGMSAFQYMGIDPAFNNIFNQAMAGVSTAVMAKVLEKYAGFEGLKSLVDVAGGTGRTLNMIVSKYPSIKGINFDLPHVTKSAPPYPGIQHVGGDMFASIPKGDTLMIKDTCHDWNDEHCLKLLKKCCEVLPKNGKLILISILMPEEAESGEASKYIAGLNYTLSMQVQGKERTEKEFEAMCKESGFSKFAVACDVYNIWAVMEFYK